MVVLAGWHVIRLAFDMVNSSREANEKVITGAGVVEIIGNLQQAGIDVWLDGGWGVDALIRKQTRQHEDLDVVVDLNHGCQGAASQASHSL